MNERGVCWDAAALMQAIFIERDTENLISKPNLLAKYRPNA